MNDHGRDENGLLNYIAATVETMRDQMVTKDDLVGLATREDLAALGTDLFNVERRLSAEITAVRGDVEQVHLRLTSIEKALTPALTRSKQSSAA